MALERKEKERKEAHWLKKDKMTHVTFRYSASAQLTVNFYIGGEKWLMKLEDRAKRRSDQRS